MIPRTFEEWRNCIINDCRINLNQDFAAKRLAVYSDKDNPETQKFISVYGESHLNNIIHWLKQI